MGLYRNTSKTRLILDKVPGTNRMYQCEPAGTTTPRGKPMDWVEIEDAHLELPGIAEALKSQILVKWDGMSMAEAKGKEEPPKDPPPADDKTPEPPPPDLMANIADGQPASAPLDEPPEIVTEGQDDEPQEG